MMRWVVRAGDGHCVRDVLARAGADADALAEGRVFVGSKRVARSEEAVRPGDVVTVSPRPQAVSSSDLAVGEARILLQLDDLVAADKPAGMPTIPDQTGAAHALVTWVARALGVPPARVHPTSRLDREVSGAVVFSLTREATQRLLRARAEGRYERRYVAVASKPVEPPSGTWDAPIGRAEDPRRRAVRGRDATTAITRYALTGLSPSGAAMLAVAPQTGRTHQIRVHASSAGAPLVGDAVYGGPARLTLPTGQVLRPRRIALHAARVVVPGKKGDPCAVVSPVPPELEALWSALGGEPAAWELSLTCALP
jgi:23S rRNA-/tRNA-specific pseudouridylate synthase